MKVNLEDAERAVYLQTNGWNWKPKKSKKPKQRVFRYGSIELLQPSITVYRS